jgi:hypothetical protein
LPIAAQAVIAGHSFLGLRFVLCNNNFALGDELHQKIAGKAV